jgi:FdrA protein
METKPESLLDHPLIVINIGLQGFAEALQQQGVEVVQVDGAPPAGGDQELIDLLDGML